MKRQSIALLIGLALILGGVLAWAGPAPNAVILAPPAGSEQEKDGFDCTTGINTFAADRAEGLHYWVTLADVGAGTTPRLHWPKYYVREAHYTAQIFDGSPPPPTPGRQPMVILLLKVGADDNSKFSEWIRNGRATGHYPGLRIKPTQIADQRLIYFSDNP